MSVVAHLCFYDQSDSVLRQTVVICTFSDSYERANFHTIILTEFFLLVNFFLSNKLDFFSLVFVSFYHSSDDRVWCIDFN